MFSVNHVMLFLRDTFFSFKGEKGSLSRFDSQSLCTLLDKIHTNMYFTFMYSICIVLVSKQDPHRIMQSQRIQAVKEVRNSPVQPPAYSRAISEVQSGFSGLWVLKTSRVGNYTVSFPPPLQGEEVSPFIQPEHLLFQLRPILPLPPTMHSCERPDSISSVTSLLSLCGRC